MAQDLYFTSNAAATSLSSSISNSATSITVGAVTGFPVSYPYLLILDPETASEEVVLVTAGGGTTLTVTRGYDSTTALAHTAGAVVRHGVSAKAFNDFYTHKAASSAVHGLTGTVVGTTDTQTLTNKTLTAPAATGSLASFGGAWTTYVPTLTNLTLGNGTMTARWTQVGKTVTVAVTVILGSTSTVSASAASTPRFSLPVAAVSDFAFGGAVFKDLSASNQYVGSSALGSTTDIVLQGSTGLLTSTAPFTFATGDTIAFSLTYEAA